MPAKFYEPIYKYEDFARAHPAEKADGLYLTARWAEYQGMRALIEDAFDGDIRLNLPFPNSP